MEIIRGKSLQEWKDYCKSDDVPIKTMKYITVLEELLEAINYTRCYNTFEVKQRVIKKGQKNYGYI